MMKLYKYGGLVSVLTLVVAAVVFAQWRNSQREIVRVEVSFADNRHDFLNVKTVNKLLILNQELSTIGVKDTLALSSIEAGLEAYAVVRNAEVFTSPSRVLTVSVEERIPLLRIIGNETYYVDIEAEKVPLSDHFTAHVPLFFGTPSEKQTEALVGFMQKINADDFLKKEIVQIESQAGGYLLKIRSYDFIIEWGAFTSFEQKAVKLKTLCKYLDAVEEKPDFTRINLKYNQQVIASS
jgi:cell division protein FtsQ